jgi:uncharacterized protein (UPF0335 family)
MGACQMASKESSNIAAEPTIGHNSSMSSDDRDQLKNFIARIEALAEERDQLSEDIKSIHAEAKSQGYDIKALREIIRIRKKDPDEDPAKHHPRVYAGASGPNQHSTWRSRDLPRQLRPDAAGLNYVTTERNETPWKDQLFLEKAP